MLQFHSLQFPVHSGGARFPWILSEKPARLASTACVEGIASAATKERGGTMRRRTKFSASATMGLLAALAIAVPAHADVSPPNCKDNRADPGIGRDVLLARPGDTVNF